MTAFYRDVMLDWAVAELMSPYLRTIETWIWANPAWEPWRDHVRKHGRNAWTHAQEDTLIQAINVSRKPVIDIYGPRPESRIEPYDISIPELETLHVMPEFFPPGGTLRQLLDWVRAKPDYAPEKTAALVTLGKTMAGSQWTFGRLIVIERPGGRRILIEGYKRALAALAAGRAAAPAFIAWA